MRLREQRFLFLDCQTTGIRPPLAQMIELAWSVASADEEVEVESHLIAIPENTKFPGIVTEVTGIDRDQLKDAKTFTDVTQIFLSDIQNEPALIHYAQFEKPFLADLYLRTQKQDQIPFSILCTQQMLKRVFPNMPSQNIRAAAGFFGLTAGEFKRAGHHVAATHQIWRGLLPELEKLGIHTLTELQAFLKQTAAKKPKRYEYRLDRIKRLELPDQPGIYRMIAKSGEVLYVGKATSLKSRVNSYFRGQKNRDQRKLEMLAQVWDLQVEACVTPLEAALLESDEIKKFNPRYNVVLKRGRRHLLFYNRDFSASAIVQSPEFSYGPLRNSNWIEHLRLLFQSLHQAEFEQIFFTPILPEILKQGWEMFQTAHHLPEISSIRQLLAKGLWLHRNYEEPSANEDEAEEVEEEEEERDPTPEEIAGKFERLLRRAGREYERSKKLTQLLNARIRFHAKNGPRELHFHNGKQGRNQLASRAARPWIGLGLEEFDRMSILLSELTKYEHEIELNCDPKPGQISTPPAP